MALFFFSIISMTLGGMCLKLKCNFKQVTPYFNHFAPTAFQVLQSSLYALNGTYNASFKRVILSLYVVYDKNLRRDSFDLTYTTKCPGGAPVM